MPLAGHDFMVILDFQLSGSQSLRTMTFAKDFLILNLARLLFPGMQGHAQPSLPAPAWASLGLGDLPCGPSLWKLHCTLISQRTMKTLRLFPPMRSLWGADGTGSSCRKISNCSYRKSSHMWVIMSRFREFPEEWNSTDTVLFFVFPFGSWGTNEEKRGKIIC